MALMVPGTRTGTQPHGKSIGGPEIMTGIGPVAQRCPRMRDCVGEGGLSASGPITAGVDPDIDRIEIPQRSSPLCYSFVGKHERSSGVKRREFITLIGGAAAWPLGARAQQAALPVIGFLNSGSASGREPLVAAFNRGLSETGYFGDRNAVIEYRWAEGKYDRLPALAADLISRRVDVIAATGGMVATLSAKAGTTTIPIVGIFDADPIAAGLVASLNRPGRNLTGVSLIASVIEAKQLELLRELAPTAGVVALLINPSNPNADTISKNLQAAASALGLQLHVLTASTERDFDTVPTALAQLRASALIFATDPFFLDHRSQLIALTMRLALPAIFGRREFVVEGGLASYA